MTRAGLRNHSWGLVSTTVLEIAHAGSRFIVKAGGRDDQNIQRGLGVRIAPGSAIHLSRLEVGRGEQSVLFSAWLVAEWEGAPTNVAPDEHDEIRWFRLEELPPLIHEPVGTALVEAMRGARA